MRKLPQFKYFYRQILVIFSGELGLSIENIFMHLKNQTNGKLLSIDH